MGGREKGDRRPKQWLPRRGSMAGGEELTGTLGTGAMGHGSMNRGHRGREGVHANSPRPRERSEDAAEAVVAKAAMRRSTTLTDWALEAMKRGIESMGRRRGARGSHRGEKRGGNGSGMVDHTEGRTVDLGVLRCGGSGFLEHWRTRKQSGGDSREGGEGLGSVL